MTVADNGISNKYFQTGSLVWLALGGSYAGIAQREYTKVSKRTERDSAAMTGINKPILAHWLSHNGNWTKEEAY